MRFFYAFCCGTYLPHKKRIECTNKCLVLVVRYFDYIKEKVKDTFFGLIKLDRSDSKAIYTAITEYFSNSNIPNTNLDGFASDNASVMMGKKSGVKTD